MSTYEDAITTESDSGHIHISKGFRKHLHTTLYNCNSTFEKAFEKALSTSEKRKASSGYYKKAFLETYNLNAGIFKLKCSQILDSETEYHSFKELLYFACLHNKVKLPAEIKQVLIESIALTKRRKEEEEERQKLRAQEEEYVQKQRQEREKEAESQRQEQEKRLEVQRQILKKQKEDRHQIATAHIHLTLNQLGGTRVRQRKYKQKLKMESGDYVKNHYGSTRGEYLPLDDSLNEGSLEDTGILDSIEESSLSKDLETFLLENPSQMNEVSSNKIPFRNKTFSERKVGLVGSNSFNRMFDRSKN